MVGALVKACLDTRHDLWSKSLCGALALIDKRVSQ